MSKAKRTKIEVQGTSVGILTQAGGDYISLTDMVRNVNGAGALIEQRFKNKDTVLFLGVWERLNNPGLNPVEFDGMRMPTGLKSYVLTPKKRIEKTAAIGLRSSAGRFGGTFVHKDIAFEFAPWVSVEFRLYFIKEFQRLKDEENALMSDLVPLLKKRAGGREVSGLSAYEQ